MKPLILLIFINIALFSSGLKKDVPLVTNEIYTNECGSCHFAYFPGLLPQNSWEKLMSGLDNHFGDDASVDEQTFQTLSKFLNDNSAEKNMNYKRSRKIVKSIAKDEVYIAISKTPYIHKKHKKIRKDLITQKEVKGLFNCTACHKSAKKAIFNDDDVNIPNYGKWED
ncbi:cytochrome C [Malaciobacter mytili]|uniref:Cytochrome C n=1 Tax=Malaciobacter mytili LMG 24559 TaxID=1032238 RepID=A0AAX2ACA7_9BACT|nr:diheme cytochrome c [Malaciobacter mytili]AXH16291.1 diheme cytochrome c [Malaciobacter mytili LMG 24559]RXI44695.1 cytochrome C [Malaciobacter mytili]RXK13804.1 cytochrome C [Malaciobacter mytili LMG 24559]